MELEVTIVVEELECLRKSPLAMEEVDWVVRVREPHNKMKAREMYEMKSGEIVSGLKEDDISRDDIFLCWIGR